MKQIILGAGLLLVASIFIFLAFGERIIKYIKRPTGNDYVGIYVKDIEPSADSTYAVIMVVNNDGTGESYRITDFLPYEGKFTWTHSFDDGYSFLTCYWDNPIYEKDEVIEFLIKERTYSRNEMKFSLSGIGAFIDFPPGILLTPYMTEDGPIMAIVGQKISEQTYDVQKLEPRHPND